MYRRYYERATHLERPSVPPVQSLRRGWPDGQSVRGERAEPAQPAGQFRAKTGHDGRKVHRRRGRREVRRIRGRRRGLRAGSVDLSRAEGGAAGLGAELPHVHRRSGHTAGFPDLGAEHELQRRSIRAAKCQDRPRGQRRGAAALRAPEGSERGRARQARRLRPEIL